MSESQLITAMRNVYRRFAGPQASLSSIPLAFLRRVYGDEMTIRLDGEPFTVNLHDTIVSFQILAFKRYEPIETALLRRLVKAGAYVVDVGANIGFFAVDLGRLVKPQGRVLAIEPDPGNARLLRKNVSARALNSVVEIAETALGESAGTATLYRDRWGNNGDHRLYPDADLATGTNAAQEMISVPIVRLDDLVASWPRVDFIKMDIQGFEAYALGGMRETIARNPGLQLFMEFWPYGLRGAGSDPLAVLRTLREFGFQIWEIPEERGSLVELDANLDAAMIERVEPNRGYVNLLCARDEASVRGA